MRQKPKPPAHCSHSWERKRLFEDHGLVAVNEYPVLQDIGEGAVKDQPLHVAS